MTDEERVREVAERALAMAHPTKIEDYGKSIKVSEMAGLARALLAMMDVGIVRTGGVNTREIHQDGLRQQQISAAAAVLFPEASDSLEEEKP